MACSYDLFNRLLLEQLTDPDTATSTVTSDACDLAGYEGATFAVSFGESGDTLSGSVYWSCKLTECDTSGGTYTDVADTDVIGNTSNVFGVVNAAADDDNIYCLGYRGSKRYVKVVVTATGTHSSGTIIGIYAVKGRILHGPSGQTVQGS